MPSLEARRILRVGSSFMISLPPGWIRYLKLKPGDYLSVLIDEDLRLWPWRGEEELGANPKAGVIPAGTSPGG